MSKRTYEVDGFGNVTAHLPGGGTLRSQTVEALLLFELLRIAEGREGRGLKMTAEPVSRPDRVGGGK
jgi:hypothetical protein